MVRDTETGEELPRFVFRDGYFFERGTNYCEEARIQYMPDYPERETACGKVLSSRSQLSEFRHKHGLVPYEPLEKRPKGYMDPKIAAANGERVSEEKVEWWANRRSKIMKSAGME